MGKFVVEEEMKENLKWAAQRVCGVQYSETGETRREVEVWIIYHCNTV